MSDLLVAVDEIGFAAVVAIVLLVVFIQNQKRLGGVIRRLEERCQSLEEGRLVDTQKHSDEAYTVLQRNHEMQDRLTTLLGTIEPLLHTMMINPCPALKGDNHAS